MIRFFGKNYNFKRFLAVLTVLFMLGVSVQMGIYASATTQDQIDQAEDEIDDLKGELEENQDNIDDLKGEKLNITMQLDLLNATLEEIGLSLEDLEDQILLKEADISQAKAALEELEAEQQKQYDAMVLRIRAMYERNESSILNAILSAGSLADILNVADYFESIENYDKTKLEEYRAGIALMEEEKAGLELEYELLSELKEEAQTESERVAQAILETQAVVDQYAEEIAAAEALAAQYEEEIRAKEEDLEYLYKKLEEEKANSDRASQGEWRDISEVTFEEGDRYLLANLIYCEAGGEPYEGQVAVGAVVINRMLSGVFPDTMTGVIYAPNQFSPAGSGRLALALAQNKATDSCYKAADEAMSGVTNVGTCVYFRTPIEGLTGIQIGGHIFY